MTRCMLATLLSFPIICSAQNVTINVPENSSVSINVGIGASDDSWSEVAKDCAAAAGMSLGIAKDAATGTSLKAALKFADDRSIFGPTTQTMHQITVLAHTLIKQGQTPSQIHDLIYKECMAGG